MMLPIRTYQFGVIIKKDELMRGSVGKHLAQQVLGIYTDTATVLPEVFEHDPDAHNRTSPNLYWLSDQIHLGLSPPSLAAYFSGTNARRPTSILYRKRGHHTKRHI